MSIILFHGEDIERSYYFLNQKIGELKKLDWQLTNLEGRELDLSGLMAATAQADFFATKKLLVVKNLMARPKSKLREQLIVELAKSEAEVLLWEGKKVTPAALKSLGRIQSEYYPESQNIWILLNKFASKSERRGLVETYEKTLTESEPLYILAMLIWQVQQLLDAKCNNYHGAPFKLPSLLAQAEKYTVVELLEWHHKLIELDFSAKSGQLKMVLSEQILLTLLGIEQK